jgi:hypothetical protein
MTGNSHERLAAGPERAMKKAKSESNDWLRPEYHRSDLGEVVRGKYARRCCNLTQRGAGAEAEPLPVADAAGRRSPRQRRRPPSRER